MLILNNMEHCLSVQLAAKTSFSPAGQEERHRQTKRSWDVREGRANNPRDPRSAFHGVLLSLLWAPEGCLSLTTGELLLTPPLKDFWAPKFSKGFYYLQKIWQFFCKVFIIHKKKSPAAGFYYLQNFWSSNLGPPGVDFFTKMLFLP